MHCGNEPGMLDCSPIGTVLSPVREKLENGRMTGRLRICWGPIRDRAGRGETRPRHIPVPGEGGKVRNRRDQAVRQWIGEGRQSTHPSHSRPTVKSIAVGPNRPLAQVRMLVPLPLGWADKAQSHKSRTRSSRLPSALEARHNRCNRKRTGRHRSA